VGPAAVPGLSISCPFTADLRLGGHAGDTPPTSSPVTGRSRDALDGGLPAGRAPGCGGSSALIRAARVMLVEAAAFLRSGPPQGLSPHTGEVPSGEPEAAWPSLVLVPKRYRVPDRPRRINVLRLVAAAVPPAPRGDQQTHRQPQRPRPARLLAGTSAGVKVIEVQAPRSGARGHPLRAPRGQDENPDDYEDAMPPVGKPT
jgi:hypothetical protein